MSLNLDFRGDFENYYSDSAELVTLRTQTAPGTYSSLAGLSAVRGQPSTKERAPTAGVYTGSDLQWIIPGAALPTGTTPPRPGDQIREDPALGGADWTLLTVEHEQLDGIYTAYAVNLALANGLRELVTIKQAVPAQDAAGGNVPTFTTRTTVYARIQEQAGDELDARGKSGTRRRYTVFVAANVSGIEVSDQLVDASGNVYDITGWTNPDRIDELQQISCERSAD